MTENDKHLTAGRIRGLESPEGSKYFIDGAFYKVGLHDNVYIHNNIEWIKSNKSIHELTIYNGTRHQL